jgi:hypothetical protein
VDVVRLQDVVEAQRVWASSTFEEASVKHAAQATAHKQWLEQMQQRLEQVQVRIGLHASMHCIKRAVVSSG